MASIPARLTVLEELLLAETATKEGPLLARLQHLEDVVLGSQGTGSLLQRLTNLEELTFGDQDGADSFKPGRTQDTILGQSAGRAELVPRPPKGAPPGIDHPPWPPRWEYQETTSAAAVTDINGLEEYAKELCLNQDALTCLHQLPRATLAAVKAEFHLSPGARDPSALLIAFATRKHWEIAGENLRWERAGHTQNAARNAETGEDARVFVTPWHAKRGRQDVSTGVSNVSALQKYAEELALNEDAVRCLEQLPEATLAAVMGEFRLSPGARDPSALFIAFATRKHRELTGEVLRRERASHGTSAVESGEGKAAAAHEASLEQYSQHLGLNEDAVICLHHLPPGILKTVVSSFHVKPDTKDVSALFISFARAQYFKVTGERLRGPWQGKTPRLE